MLAFLKSKENTAPLLILSVMVFSVCISFAGESFLGFDNNFYLSLIIIQLLVMVIPATFYIKLTGMKWSAASVRFFSPAKLYFVAVAVLTELFGSTVIRLGMSYAGNSSSVFGKYYDTISQLGSDSIGVIYLLLTFALVPACCQELICSGVFLSEYRDKSYISQILLCGVMGAFLRFDFSTFILFVFNGAVCAFAVLVTHSVFSAMIIHFSFNAFNLFLEKYILRIITQSEYMTLCAFILISGFLICCFLLFAECERMYHNEAIDQHKIKIKLVQRGEALESAPQVLSLDGESSEVKEDDDDGEAFGSYLKKRSFFGEQVEKLGEKLRQVFSPLASPTLLICLVLYIAGCIIVK